MWCGMNSAFARILQLLYRGAVAGVLALFLAAVARLWWR